MCQSYKSRGTYDDSTTSKAFLLDVAALQSGKQGPHEVIQSSEQLNHYKVSIEQEHQHVTLVTVSILYTA